MFNSRTNVNRISSFSSSFTRSISVHFEKCGKKVEKRTTKHKLININSSSHKDQKNRYKKNL